VTIEPIKPVVLVGLIRLREHCIFTWRETERGGRRSVEVRATHCAECVGELQALGYVLVREDQGDR
jgi:hypothetical protein